MEFDFRGKRVSAENCLVIKNGSLVYVREKQFSLDDTTFKHFRKKEKTDSIADSDKDNDSENKRAICRSLSFKTMAICICQCFNGGKARLIGELLKAVYLIGDCGSMTRSQNGDQTKAYNIYKKICSSKADYTELCNELLYILNNAYSNLRVGMSDGGNAASDAYNPTAWEYRAESKCFAITGEDDFKRLKPIIDADMQSTLRFYIREAEGEEPMLYSSENSPYISAGEFKSFSAEVSVCDQEGEIRISKYETDV